MNKLITKIFEDNGGRFRVRALEIENEPWFVAVDVCTNIGLSNTTESVKALDEDEKGTLRISEGGPEVNIITEAGLYSLVIRSNKPEAKLFKRWVTHEVIPSIRKTGSYSIQKQIPKTFAEALRLAADLEEERQKLLPKADQFDKFISGENYQDMNTAAKALSWGRNKLFAELRRRGILMSGNRPYQRYIDTGYFVVKEKPINMGGTVFNKPQTYVTAKGLSWLEKVLSESGVLA